MIEAGRLTKQEKFKSFWAYFNWALCVFGMERLQAPGMTLAMLPIADKYYQDDEEGKIALLKRHRVFFNTEMNFGQIIIGLVLRLEEAKARGQEISDDYIQGIKAGLMGPFAGIGDAIFQATIPPIHLSIIIGLINATKSPWPIFLYWITFYAYCFAVSYYMFNLGYNVGESSTDKILGQEMALVQQAIAVLGLVVTGAVTASYVNVGLNLTYTSDLTTVNIQSILDSIFPKLLPISLVIFGYWLMSKKHLSPLKLMGIFVLIAVVGSLIGVL